MGGSEGVSDGGGLLEVRRLREKERDATRREEGGDDDFATISYDP